ncbi:hypothetical protein NHF46_08365 [Arthrobacter alpinus]|nr:hypothetical protein [Arthrobacter alpinus]
MTPQRAASVSAAQGWDGAANYQLFAAGSNPTFGVHEQTFGPLSLETIGADFISVLEQSGLTGRGGAAFASWRKLAATDQGRGGALLGAKPVVIANGAEGTPQFQGQDLADPRTAPCY